MKNLSEITRLLHNLIRLGTIAEVQTVPPRARVKTGDNLTDWLPWFASAAGDMSAWRVPSKGEQVMLFSPSGDLAQAVIMPGIYSDDMPAPSDDENTFMYKFPDGTELLVNSSERKLIVNSNGQVEVNAQQIKATAQTVKVSAQQIDFNEGGAGVVTGQSICAYTGSPHPHTSMTVRAGL